MRKKMQVQITARVSRKDKARLEKLSSLMGTTSSEVLLRCIDYLINNKTKYIERYFGKQIPKARNLDKNNAENISVRLNDNMYRKFETLSKAFTTTNSALLRVVTLEILDNIEYIQSEYSGSIDDIVLPEPKTNETNDQAL